MTAEQLTEEATSLPAAATGLNVLRPHLVLNIDINKTIIMTDAVGGKSADFVVNEELAAAAWGREVGGTWVMQAREPSVQRPLTHSGLMPFTSFDEWLISKHPGSKNKKMRAQLKSDFTYPGSPGAQLHESAADLRSKLLGPDGKDVRLIPAFFQLLLHLKRERRSFTICFRTFGEDLMSVCEELTAFCEGRHPSYPGVRMDGSDGEPDYRLSVENRGSYGTFHRLGGEMAVVMGTTEQPGEGKYRDAEDCTIGFYKQFQGGGSLASSHGGGVEVVTGFDRVRDFINEKCSKPCTLGLRDDYAYWRSKDLTAEGGKVFFFEPSWAYGAAPASQHAMFFDDNIGYEEFHIVQPISLRAAPRTLCTICLMESHICKAHPLEAICSADYFVRHVAKLEAGYIKKRAVFNRMRRLMCAPGRAAQVRALAESSCTRSVSARSGKATRGMSVFLTRVPSESSEGGICTRFTMLTVPSNTSDGTNPMPDNYDPWERMRKSRNWSSIREADDEVGCAESLFSALPGYARTLAAPGAAGQDGFSK